jgi:hypothetical protein
VNLFIVKRDKRTRGTVWGVSPVRGIRMRERVYNFSVYFGVGRTHRILLTIVYTVMHTLRKLKHETAYDPQREILRMRANPTCVSKSV